MKKIMPLLLLVLLLNGCASTVDTTPSQSPPSNNTPTSSAGIPAKKSLPNWQYALKKDGLYRTDQNTGDTFKINSQRYISDLIITDDWVYFNDENSLYRMDNENRSELIADEHCQCLNLNGDWLYFISNGKICRIKFDGSKKEILRQSKCNRMTLTDKYIFYTLDIPENNKLNNEPGADDSPWYLGELHRSDLNAENDVKCADMITDLGVWGNVVYFADGMDNSLNAMTPETLQKTTVYAGNFIEHLYLGAGCAFFILDRNLFRLSLLDETMTQLTKGGWNSCYGVLDGYVYGFNQQDGLYRFKVNGVELEHVE